MSDATGAAGARTVLEYRDTAVGRLPVGPAADAAVAAAAGAPAARAAPASPAAVLTRPAAALAAALAAAIAIVLWRRSSS